MAERILFPEWRRQFEGTKYPFSQRTTLANAGGRFLTETTFLDAALYPVGAGGRLFLSAVVLTHQTAALTLATPDQPQIATATFSLTAPPDQVVFSDAAGRPAGVLISESQRLALFQSWGVGTHEFSVEQTEFCPSVVFPTPEVGVRGFVLETGEVFVGDVWIVGDDGVVVRLEETDVPDDDGCGVRRVKVVRLDVVGDPLFRRRLCSPRDLFHTPRFVKTLRVVAPNGTVDCPPGPAGNVLLVTNGHLAADTILRIRTTGEAIDVSAVGTTSLT